MKLRSVEKAIGILGILFVMLEMASGTAGQGRRQQGRGNYRSPQSGSGASSQRTSSYNSNNSNQRPNYPQRPNYQQRTSYGAKPVQVPAPAPPPYEHRSIFVPSDTVNMEATPFEWYDNGDICRDPFKTVCDESPLHRPRWATENWDFYKAARHQFRLLEMNTLEENTGPLTNPVPAERRALDFYKACKSYNQTKFYSIQQHLTDTIRKSPYGKWPMSDHGFETRKPSEAPNVWKDLDVYYMGLGADSAFHDISVKTNENGQPVIVLGPPEFVIPKTVLLGLGTAFRKRNTEAKNAYPLTAARQTYRKYIINLIGSISDEWKTYVRNSYIYDRVDDMIDLEMRLAQITLPDKNLPPADKDFNAASTKASNNLTMHFKSMQWYHDWFLSNSRYYDMTFKGTWAPSPILKMARELSHSTTVRNPCDIDWVNLLTAIGDKTKRYSTQPTILTEGGVKSTPVIISNVIYHLKFCVLIRSTSPDIIADYIHFRYLRNSALTTDDGWRDFTELATAMGFGDSVLGRTRKSMCAAENLLKKALHARIVNGLVKDNPNMLPMIHEMYTNIMNSLLNNLLMRDYHHQAAYDALEKHINKIKIKLYGDIEALNDPRNTQEAPLPVTTSNYYYEKMQQRGWHLHHILQYVAKATSPHEWEMEPHTPGVFIKLNQLQEPTMYIPAAMLREPFVYPKRESLFTYAGLGVEIAMALWHSIYAKDLMPYEADDWLEYCLIGMDEYDPGIDSKVRDSVFQSSKQVLDGVKIALEAYALSFNMDRNSEAFYRDQLAPPHAQQFLSTYIATQCESYYALDPKTQWSYGVASTRPTVDEHGLRVLNYVYPLKEHSTLKFRVETFGRSNLFKDTFACEKPPYSSGEEKLSELIAVIQKIC